MRVLLLADIPGWIVDRIVDRMIAGMPEVEFVKGFYSRWSTEEILRHARTCDMIHYGNWDIQMHWPRIMEAERPILMSVRSHRFPAYVREVSRTVGFVHVVNRRLLEDFPGAHYIPDGLMIRPEVLRVGMAGKLGSYKGSHLVARVCDEIGARLLTATDVAPQHMASFYRDVDVVVCASENEGFSTIVMECLALNKPVVSTRVGVPHIEGLRGVTWVNRTVEDIKDALLGFWPARGLDAFAWEKLCAEFQGLYSEVVS